MALTKTIRLTDLGLADVETTLYININAISIQLRPDGILLHAALNLYASETARRENKNVIGIQNISGPYTADMPVNIHTAVYNLAKTYPDFADAENA